MPFKSEAQRRKFGELVKTGKMEQSVFDEWNKEIGDKKLPEKVKPVNKSQSLLRQPRRTR